MNLFRAAIAWLLTKHVKEENRVSEPLNDTAVPEPIMPVAIAETAAAPAVAVKEGVQDFEKALQFVRDGVAKLGDAAESELIALAKKYL